VNIHQEDADLAVVDLGPTGRTTARATPQEAVPFLGKPAGVEDQHPSESPHSSATWWRSSARTASSSQAPAPTKCCTGLRGRPAWWAMGSECLALQATEAP